MRINRLPLTYGECRARFARSAVEANLPVSSHPIDKRGPDSQELSIDTIWIGAKSPRRVLTVMSGTHGVEGFIGSALQCDLLARLDRIHIPDDMAVWFVHALNPWGMAWWRRQNESNVDLNRNWMRNDIEPDHNEAYEVLHAYACPDTPELPSVEDLMIQAFAMVEEHSLEWVRDAITTGQYSHPDGLHFGGNRTEQSNRILQSLVVANLTGVERCLTIDLHTGHGARGAVTLLSNQPIGSPQDEFFRTNFGSENIMATAENPDASTGVKSGQISNGFELLLGEPTSFATSVEFGTAPDEEQLAATYLESWVHRHGDINNPEHREVTWRYRCCFTPDDPEWESTCMKEGNSLLDRAVEAVAAWEA